MPACGPWRTSPNLSGESVIDPKRTSWEIAATRHRDNIEPIGYAPDNRRGDFNESGVVEKQIYKEESNGKR